MAGGGTAGRGRRAGRLALGLALGSGPLAGPGCAMAGGGTAGRGRRAGRLALGLALGSGLLGLAVLGLDHALPPDLSRLHSAGTEILDREGRTLSVLPAPGGIWRLATG